MRYFTITTLVLLASNAYAEETSSNTLTPKSPSTFSMLKNLYDEAFYGAAHLLSQRKNLIKAKLEVPKPKTTDELVKIEPTENLCISNTLEEYSNSLFKENEPEKIEKIIFCPNAPAFLKKLSSGKLLANIKPELLKNLIASLMLRKATLGGLYSQAYIKENYMQCFHELFNKVYSNDPGKAEHWPCTSETCDAQTIEKSFATIVSECKPCENVLKEPLIAYGKKVSELITSKLAQNSVELREAILENLNGNSSITTEIMAAFDKISESDHDAAAAKISENLSEIEAIIKNFNPNSKIYTEADALFKQKLKITPPATETLQEEAPTKTVKQ